MFEVQLQLLYSVQFFVHRVKMIVHSVMDSYEHCMNYVVSKKHSPSHDCVSNLYCFCRLYCIATKLIFFFFLWNFYLIFTIFFGGFIFFFQIAFQVLVKALISLDPGQEMEFLKKQFQEFIAGLMSLPIKVPGSRLYRSLQASYIYILSFKFFFFKKKN